MDRLARLCPHPMVGRAAALDDAPRARTHPGWPWVLMGGVALTLVASGALATRPGAAPPASPAQPRIEARLAADLPVTDLGWVRMRDHGTVTIGDRAGQGDGLGDLLVAADTTLAPGGAFPVHRHAGIEVVTIVLDGTLSLDEGGRSTELPAGTVHVIAAGAGVQHTEANHGAAPARFVQLWLASRAADRAPASEHVGGAAGADLAPLPLALVSPDVQVRRATLAAGATAHWSVARGRVAYVVCADGAIELDTVHLGDGDGATLTDGRFVATAGATPATVIVVDLPAPPEPAAR